MYLTCVSLKNKELYAMHPKSFNNISSLLSVNLANNNLMSLPKELFCNVKNLFLFILYNYPLTKIKVDIFYSVNFSKLWHSIVILEFSHFTTAVSCAITSHPSGHACCCCCQHCGQVNM